MTNWLSPFEYILPLTLWKRVLKSPKNVVSGVVGVGLVVDVEFKPTETGIILLIVCVQKWNFMHFKKSPWLKSSYPYATPGSRKV